MSGPAPGLTVIVPTCGRPDQLEHCLTALSRQTCPPGGFEVIVVDDGGAQPLDALIRRCSVALELRLLRQAKRGPGVARNAGARLARAPFLAFLDDDCRPEPDWLVRLAEVFARHPDRLVGGRVTNALAENPYAVASHLILELAYDHHNADPTRPRFFASNNMAVPAAGFRRIGGFDESFPFASEDRDFCARWLEAGMALEYAPDAVVAHAHRLTLRRYWIQHFGYGRGAWRFHRARRRRGHGQLAHDLAFHWRFLRRAGGRLTRRPRRPAAGMAALLVVWQVANAAGFLWEAARRPTPLAGR